MSGYLPVSTTEKTGVGEFPDASYEDDLAPKTKPHYRQWLTRWPWIVHFIVFAGYVTYILWTQPPYQSDCLQGNEGIYSDPPIKYERVVFQRSAFHDLDDSRRTLYEGPPDLENNAHWDRLMSVRIVSLAQDEANRIPNGTARSLVNSKEFVVELEMFHQLHCLKRLRQELWKLDNTLQKRDETQRQRHFDYLRQAIMCHGDITPVTFEWNEELGHYLAHHATVHQCRNSERIFDWVAGRNTEKMAVDAKHEFVAGAGKEE